MGKCCTSLYKQLALLIGEKLKIDYNVSISMIRCRLSFALLRSSILCIRGTRSSTSRPLFDRHPITITVCRGPPCYVTSHVNPTFNLADFDVTPITYCYCLLKSLRTNNSPVFIGPTLIHYKKTFASYLFFASSLIDLRRELQGVRAFGTDGEKPLADTFSHEFRYAVRLTCFIHLDVISR